MGVKYKSAYKDTEGVVREIRLSKSDFSGTPIEWVCGVQGVNYVYNGSDEIFGSPIKTSQAKLNFIFEEEYDLSDFTPDRKTYFCEIILEDSGRVEWSGWVEPWDASHEYMPASYEVSLTASCGLAHLSKKKYTNPAYTTKKTGLKIIQECLEIIGSELPIRLSTHMRERSHLGDATRGFESFEVDTNRYYDSSGDPMYCDVILSDLLNKFNAEIVQWNNIWVIRGIVDHAIGVTSYVDIPYKTNPMPSLPAWPSVININSTTNAKAYSLDGGVIRIQAPINKYRTEADLNPKKTFFENGNMFLWSEDGLVGWDFTHMPKGNPGWEKFVINSETDQSILKINGRSPENYRKKRKKKLFQVLVPILTGAVGANLKNQYYDIEPTEWIDSSVGSISKGDKQLKISFDYSTAPHSSNVMISIRLVNKWFPGQDRWVAPGTANAGVSEEFKWITLPPVDPENSIYKGAINVASNPNYPAASTNWTYGIVGVPDGEIRRIGGATGAIVKNGDTIMAKYGNGGGVQASVGEYWTIVRDQKGTFETTVLLDKINLVSTRYENDPLPFQDIIVRFYKITTAGNKTGDWYKVYNLQGELSGFVEKDDSGEYATTLEMTTASTDEQADTISLITGDYNRWFSGSLLSTVSAENTSAWARRPNIDERISIYRAMMLDRLSLTHQSLQIVEGDIKLLSGTNELSYLHRLKFDDISNSEYLIVNYEYESYRRIAKVTAIEIKYREPSANELLQESFIPGVGKIEGSTADAVIPAKESSTGGIIDEDSVSLTPEEISEQISTNRRSISLFSGIPALEYIIAEESEQVVNLADYLSTVFIDNNSELEPEDQFDPEDFILTVINKPDWVSLIDIDKLEVTVTALSPKTGDFYITMSASDEEAETVLEFRIPILVTESEDFIESWPPKFINLPAIIFEKGIESTQEINIFEYLDEDGDHDGTGLGAIMLTKPNWVSESTIIFGDLKVTGESTTLGDDYITYQIGDAIGRVLTVPFTLRTVEPTELEHEIPLLGVIPASYEVPEEFTIKTIVDGLHDKYSIELKGGGETGDAIDYTFEQESDTGVYETISFEGVVGQYTYTFTTYRSDLIVKQDTVKFTLYDDEYLARVKSLLTKNNASIGEITEDGATVFVNPNKGNIKVELLDVIHDEIILELDRQSKTYADIADEYYFYEEDTEIEAGKHEFKVSIFLDGDLVERRIFEFEIGQAEVKPKQGLKLVTLRSGTTNYTVLEELPLKNGAYDLPDNYSILYEGGTAGTGTWNFYRLNNGAYTEISLENQLRIVTTVSKLLIFGSKNSTQVTDAHIAPASYRVVFTIRDKNEEVVEINQADFRFKPVLAPEDYTGLSFYDISADLEDLASAELVDANMANSGGVYPLNNPRSWGVSFRKLKSGLSFDKVVVRIYRENIELTWGAHNDGFLHLVVDETDDLGGAFVAYTYGKVTSEEPRPHLFVSMMNELVYIDEPAKYKVEFTISLLGEVIEILTSEFELYDPEYDPPVEDECCGSVDIWESEW